ncbi:unnamed protein product [Closterium sp. NIES-54]
MAGDDGAEARQQAEGGTAHSHGHSLDDGHAAHSHGHAADSHAHAHSHHDDHHHHHHHDHPATGDASAPSDEFRGADGRVYHSHDGLAPHSHEPLDSAGSFALRAPPLPNRDLAERAFTGAGQPCSRHQRHLHTPSCTLRPHSPPSCRKTALMLALCRTLRDQYSLAAVTNDIFTQEDGEFLIKHAALSPPGRIRAVETGGCPHAAIREDISINLGPLEELSTEFKADMLLCESGGGEWWHCGISCHVSMPPCRHALMV